MLRDLRRYALGVGDEIRTRHGPDAAQCRASIPAPDISQYIVWEGTVSEYRSLLILREAELVAARAQLTGDDRADWHIRNVIAVLEIMVSDLRTLLHREMT
jgi:hypothetical protein